MDEWEQGNGAAVLAVPESNPQAGSEFVPAAEDGVVADALSLPVPSADEEVARG